MTEPIYLDYNATAPLHPDAQAAMHAAFGAPANPSSVHFHGRAARAKIEHARQQLADLIGGRAQDITFTSGGTEANNMVLAGFPTVIMSEIEHDAVRAARPDAITIKTHSDGVISLPDLADKLAKLSPEQSAETLVSVMAANNETGAIQPISDIAELCRRSGVKFHSDMVQMLGKKQLNLSRLKVDFASFSAHKIGGPAGVGAVWSAAGLRPTSLIKGGGQEQGVRSGTENIFGIIGFGAAAQAASEQLDGLERLGCWRDEFEHKLKAAIPELHVMAAQAERLANTSALFLPFSAAEMAVMRLDLAGFSISAGAACSSGKVKSSHVIAAMGMADKAHHVIRVSSGWKTQPDDMLKLAEQLIEMYKHSQIR